MAGIADGLLEITKAVEVAEATEVAAKGAAEGSKATEAAAKAFEAAGAAASNFTKTIFSEGSAITKLTPEALAPVAEALKNVPDTTKELIAGAAKAPEIVKMADTVPSFVDDLIKTGKLEESEVITAIKEISKDPEALEKLTKALSPGSKLAWAKLGLLVVVSGGAIGAGLYIAKKLKDQDKGQQACNSYCLPSNWDEIDIAGVGGTLTSKDIVYRTLATITSDNGGKLPKTIDGQLKFDSNFPLCKATISDCGTYCDKKCRADIKTDTSLIDGPLDAVKNLFGTAKDEFKNLLDGLGLGGDIGKYLKYFGIAVGVILIIFFFINKT